MSQADSRREAPKFSRSERLRYRADTALATGDVWWVVVWLAGLMLGFLVLMAGIIGGLGLTDQSGRKFGYVEGFWQALLRALDPGTMAGDGAWPLRLTSLAVTLFGVLLVSTVIGITATGISARLTQFGRGRAPMIETGHTLVLGWSAKVQTIVTQLAEGREGDRSASVVVLSDHDKSEMDDFVTGWLRNSPAIRVLTRTGSSHNSSDLRLVNPQFARSIVVLRNGAIDGDARVIKTVLTLLYDINVPDHVSIIAELGNGDSATALRSVVDDRVIVVETGNLIARVMAQACRHPGVDQVMAELFSYEGSELYTVEVPDATGMTFGDLLGCFESAIPVGLISHDDKVSVRPDPCTVIGRNDRIVAIAEDVHSVQFRARRRGDVPVLPVVESSPARRSEQGLMFGFNEFAPLVLSELDDYVPPGSEMVIIADPDLVGDLDERVPAHLVNLKVKAGRERLTPGVVHRMLDEVRPDYVVVLCYRGALTPNDADARTLMTFLEVGREIAALGLGANVVAEILDPEDVRLVPADWSHEFVVTEHLSSLYITQVSENRSLAPVFADLLDAEGTEIYCKPVDWYMGAEGRVSFASLTDAALARNEIAIGFRREREGTAMGRETIINPTKSTAFELRPGDALIVLAANEL